MKYTSSLEMASTAMPGVSFRLRRVSFGRRLELARILQDRLETIQKLALSPDTPARAAQTALIGAEIDAIHLRWGLAAIEGLEIDGAPATAESLISSGPEELLREILAAVRHETGLDSEERKNFAPPSTSCAAEEPDRATRGSADHASATISKAIATAGDSSLACSVQKIRGSSGDGAIPQTSGNP
jgi:hypothetical protein